METRRKMKLGTSDKIILGVGYTLLGLFVLAVFDTACVRGPRLLYGSERVEQSGAQL